MSGREISQAAECVLVTHVISGETVGDIIPGCEESEGLSPYHLPAGHSTHPCSEICLPGCTRGFIPAFLVTLAEGMESESPSGL